MQARARSLRPRSRDGRALAALVLVLVASAPACADVRADEFRARVVRVRDGDTIEVLKGGAPVRVRLFGIDCPERGQPWSAKAKQFTAGLVGSFEVTVRVKDHDTYGRTVAQVICPDGRDLGEELVRAGLAWQYRHYSHDPTVARLEREARAAHRGIWSDPHPVPPWEFRHDGKPARTASPR